MSFIDFNTNRFREMSQEMQIGLFALRAKSLMGFIDFITNRLWEIKIILPTNFPDSKEERKMNKERIQEDKLQIALSAYLPASIMVHNGPYGP